MSAIVDISEIDPDQAEVTTPDQKDNQHEVILPLNESQTRPLTNLSPEDKIKAWELVLEQLKDGKQLTSALVKKAVREVCGEVVKKTFIDTKENLESTQLVSKLFKTQFNLLLQILYDERNNQWKSMKRSEVIKYLKVLFNVVEIDD